MLNVAVIGAGRIGAIHAGNVHAHPGARLAWVADPAPGAAAALAPATARVTLDPAEAIADPAVGAVLIASPTPTHVPLVLAAVRAGKAVFCEKPVDLDLARARAAQREVEAAGGRVMIGFNRRFDPTLAEVRRAGAAGEIDRLEQLTIVSRDPAPPPPAYIATSGGLFRDMAIHDFDYARFVLGPIAKVFATGQNVIDPEIAAAGDIDGAVTVLTAVSGAVAVIVNSRRCAYGYDQRVELTGAAGSVAADNQAATTVRRSGAGATGAGPRYLDFFLERYAAAYRLELDAFVAACDTGDPAAFTPSLADGVAALELADAALASAGEGRAIVLPDPASDPGAAEPTTAQHEGDNR
jgi:myo-inositol 2-dehydrogenase/D-chiro-inositol 1-dehydrogenase